VEMVLFDGGIQSLQPLLETIPSNCSWLSSKQESIQHAQLRRTILGKLTVCSFPEILI
jgi:hypothetical protein